MIVAIYYYNSEISYSVRGEQKYGHPKNTKTEENKLNLRIKRN